MSSCYPSFTLTPPKIKFTLVPSGSVKFTPTLNFNPSILRCGSPTVKVRAKYNRHDYCDPSEPKRDSKFDIVHDGLLIDLFETPWLKIPGHYDLEKAKTLFSTSAEMHNYNWDNRNSRYELFDAVIERKPRLKRFCSKCYRFFPSHNRWSRHNCPGLIGDEVPKTFKYEKDRKLAEDFGFPPRATENEKKKTKMETPKKKNKKN